MNNRWSSPADAFTASQSVIAFPVATCLVATITRAARTIGGINADPSLLALGAAALAGTAMFAVAVRDARTSPATTTEWLSRIGAAVANSLLLFAAAIGIEKF